MSKLERWWWLNPFIRRRFYTPWVLNRIAKRLAKRLRKESKDEVHEVLIDSELSGFTTPDELMDYSTKLNKRFNQKDVKVELVNIDGMSWVVEMDLMVVSRLK